ncbi:MAG TPA: MaoC family dehydratase [Ferrovibrio sp.]|jgi:acyl dehydratase|uniref:MaoC family dehydratase n=1 Tax=Ferrovibrio sp. TaxID=1917215 RepID=UPI002B4B4731|nr:MaoC family dehydratase [Ferrovibrio sp.]HLT79245.1 MaoC family dehydratase [Ferrovibrio sp.]
MAGLWFEDFEEGMVFNHEWTRTITEADNRWFSLLTMNTQPLHIDAHAAAKSVWGRPLVNSLFTLGCMVGMTVNDTTFGTTIANLGMSDVRFPHPLFEGDTIRMRTTVLSKRESKSRPNEGIVNLRHECFNQDDKLCGVCDRAALMMKRPKS